MNPTYRIRDWNLHFEKAQSRKVGHTKWVAIPNKHDGKGFRRVMREPDGAAVYGAWNLMLQVASKCPKRGTLADEDGPLTALDLELKTGCPESVFARAFTVLCAVGWLLVDDREPAGSGSPLVADSQHAPSTLLDPANALELQDRTLQDRTGQDRTTATERTLRVHAADSKGPVADLNAGSALVAGTQPDPSESRDDAGKAPEPGATTTSTTGKRPRKPKAKAEVNGGALWAKWVDLNREAGRADPVATGPDTAAARELAKLLPPERVPEILAAYLHDPEDWLAKQGRPLRLLPGRVNAYLNGDGRELTDAEVYERAERNHLREIHAKAGA